MDITFEEVAHVIQDARYQQAIFDTDIPKPDRRIPGPGKKFDQAAFVEENKINLSFVMAEPLGRFFLRSFVEVGSKEERVLNFTEALYNLRRRDPLGIVNALDIIALVDRFNLTVPLPGGRNISGALSIGKKEGGDDSSNGGGGGAANEDESSSVASGATIDPTHKSSKHKVPSEILVALTPESMEASLSPAAQRRTMKMGETPPPADEVIVQIGSPDLGAGASTMATAQKTSFVGTDKAAAAAGASVAVMVEKEPGSKGGGQTAWSESHVSRHDENRLDDAGGVASTFAANYSTSVNTYGAAAAAVVSRAIAAQRQHTQRSLDLNAAVQAFMESELTPAYASFTDDKRTFSYYVKLKWYSLQAVGDKQVRYHRVLGVGAFGTVNGCIVACLGSMLAMKSMMKKRIKAKNARSQVVAERQALEALAACPSPYCMRLRYAYQTKEAFHLILPLAIGGDLKFHLKDGPFSEERARIYAAEVAIGLGHIHSLGLIIRDLKPRNILLNSAGHCQISDLGLAVSIADGRTCRGRAGTEGYWSPEVINNLHYSIDADWWSYGCCLFEFHTGFSPFSCKHTGMKTRNEGTRKAKIKFPKDFPETAKPLVLALMNRTVSERLGCRGKGVQEVLSDKHLYWKPLDLDQVRRNELPAPWRPEKGVIYALSQGEIQENEDDVETRKVKLTPEDEIEFPPFVDFEDHQRDIVKVLEATINSNNQAGNRQSMSKNLQQALQNDEEKASCCSII